MRGGSAVAQHHERGLTLIEVIGSVLLLSVVLGAIFSLANYVLHYSTQSKVQLEAIALAQEGIGRAKEHMYRNPGSVPVSQTGLGTNQRFTISYTLDSDIQKVNSSVTTSSGVYLYTLEAIVFDQTVIKKLTVFIQWK